MDHEETAVSRPPSPKADTIAAPSEGELSRIAREAVHQPADPRLDRQLARMGVMDIPAPAVPETIQPTSLPAASAPELEHLDARVRRIEMMLAALVIAVGVLGLIVVTLLLR